MANPLRVNAVELLRRPGSERTIDLTVLVDDLGLIDEGGISDERFRAADPVQVHLRLESLTDGIVVNGTIEAVWHGICRRCAVTATGTTTSEVHELYQHLVTDPEAFELEGDQLDLEPMVREIVLLDAPGSPLCRDDCAGLCPTCGIDRNTSTCDCAPVVEDPRWAVLDQLRDIPDA